MSVVRSVPSTAGFADPYCGSCRALFGYIRSFEDFVGLC